jgi:hypothetical protein
VYEALSYSHTSPVTHLTCPVLVAQAQVLPRHGLEVAREYSIAICVCVLEGGEREKGDSEIEAMYASGMGGGSIVRYSHKLLPLSHKLLHLSHKLLPLSW